MKTLQAYLSWASIISWVEFPSWMEQPLHMRRTSRAGGRRGRRSGCQRPRRLVSLPEEQRWHLSRISRKVCWQCRNGDLLRNWAKDPDWATAKRKDLSTAATKACCATFCCPFSPSLCLPLCLCVRVCVSHSYTGDLYTRCPFYLYAAK